MDMGHWKCDITVPSEFYGFIYLITNTLTGRKYIGKKQAVFKHRKPARKGKKRREIVFKKSDWMTYTGSSNDLNADIDTQGKETFEFRIIRFCTSKAALAYYEAKEQFDRDALLSEMYYNGMIRCRIPRFKDVHL